MEKCKYCQAELEENGTFCPVCGRNNEETEQAVPVEETAEMEAKAEEMSEEVTSEEASAEVSVEEAAAQPEKKKATPGKIALAVAAVVVLLAALVALVKVGMDGKKAEGGTAASEAAAEETVVATIPADGNPEDVTCKGTYTVSDEEAQAEMDTVVATIGDKTLTNGQLQVYYRSALNSYLSSEYGYYVAMYGMLDYTKPLDTQISYEDQSLTWQQYFIRSALNNWQLAQALDVKAREAGLEMSQEHREYLDGLEASLTETAAKYDLTLEEMILDEFGAGVGLEEFRYFEELYYQGLPYYEAELAKMVPTEEDLEAFFEEHKEEYEAGGLTKDSKFVDVRHILVTVKGGTTDETGNTTYSEEEWAACKEEAQAILDAWLAGEKTEDSFAALANEKSEDPGSNTNGGLYTQVYEGQMVQNFNDWCFDESRAYGDYGLVETNYGYHVMFYVDSQPQWKYYAESDWISFQANTMVQGLAESFPMDVAYEKIAMGLMDLT